MEELNKQAWRFFQETTLLAHYGKKWQTRWLYRIAIFSLCAFILVIFTLIPLIFIPPEWILNIFSLDKDFLFITLILSYFLMAVISLFCLEIAEKKARYSLLKTVNQKYCSGGDQIKGYHQQKIEMLVLSKINQCAQEEFGSLVKGYLSLTESWSKHQGETSDINTEWFWNFIYRFEANTRIIALMIFIFSMSFMVISEGITLTDLLTYYEKESLFEAFGLLVGLLFFLVTAYIILIAFFGLFKNLSLYRACGKEGSKTIKLHLIRRYLAALLQYQTLK